MSRPVGPFEVIVTDLLRARSDERSEHVEATVDWHLELSRVVADAPIEGDFDLAATSGGILVRGVISGTAAHTCFRCLAEWEERFDIDVAELFASGEVGDDEYEIRGDVIDLEPAMRDAVLLWFPMRPVCSEDCPGLVASVGSDLNTGSSGDVGESSPFAVLRDLFGPGE